MDPITRQGISVAGGAAAEPGLYVDDLFSTFLYNGTSSSQTITNGIDLSGEGGMVWLKARSTGNNHVIGDTERGITKRLYTNSTVAEQVNAQMLASVNSNGFTIGNSAVVNQSSQDFVSWTFRKAPGFFDVVTWSGNSATGRQISHNLGSAPGMILIKNLNSTYGWVVYHRSQGASKYASLSSDGAFASATGSYNYFNGTEPTSTHFTVDSGNASARLNVNDFGSTYVAYVFAHDDQSFGTNSDEAIIKCGSYTGTGSSGNHVNVGFEPQLLLIKNATTASTNWMLLDVMRGLPATSGGTTSAIYANTTAAETANNSVEPSPTGFTPTAAGSYTNSSGDTFVYMAIRRPHKPPTAGTDVFGIDNGSSSSTIPNWDSGFPVDMSFFFSTFGGYNFGNAARILGSKWFKTDLPDALAADGSMVWDSNEGYGTGYQSHWYSHMFKRAPGFFDVVAYTGTGSLSGVNHNLGVTPELKIIKCRSNSSTDWWVGGSALTDLNRGYLRINFNYAASIGSAFWNSSSSDSATVFSVRNNQTGIDKSGQTQIAYLFATLDGISKVGTYSGNSGYDVNVDCGFTAGARFVLIKRIDSTGDWYVWDSLRGIVSGNDPYKLLNSTAAQVTNTDYIDPLNAGFTVTSSAPAALNASGGTYLFLAIA